MTQLSTKALEEIGADGRVEVPTYDRDQVRSGIVHIGVGGFHRAHQGVYFDDLAGCGVSDAWGVTGVTLEEPRRLWRRYVLGIPRFCFGILRRPPRPAPAGSGS